MSLLPRGTLDLTGLVSSSEEPEGDPEGVADALLTELNEALIGLNATARSGDFASYYERMRPRVYLVRTLLRLIPTRDLDPVQQFEQTKAIITQTETRAQEVGEW